MITSTIQKQVILEEASKASIKRFQIVSIPEAYNSILNNLDVTIEGAPLSQPFTVKNKELIDVPKISKFFTSLSRDIVVGQKSIDLLTEKTANLQTEFWMKMQNVKNRANNIAGLSKLEKLKVETQALWAFTDSFTTTSFIDMPNTTAWVDTSEGVAFSPSNSVELDINNNISYSTYTEGGQIDTLGSDVSLIFDGNENTSWIGLFSDGKSKLGVNVAFKTPVDISALQIDPIGLGLRVVITANTGSGEAEILNEIIYSKTTFSVSCQGLTNFKLSMNPEGITLPKSVGIRNIKFYNNVAISISSLESYTLSVPINYSEVYLDYDAKLGTSSKATASIKLGSGNWLSLNNKSWNTLQNKSNTDILINNSLVSNAPPFWVVPVLDNQANINKGSLLVGQNQIEVSAYKSNFRAGESVVTTPSNVTPIKDVFTTWLNVPVVNERTYVDRIFVKPFINQSTTVKKDANILLHQFFVEGEAYKDMSTLLLQNGNDSIAQLGYCYKIKFQVFAEESIFLNFSKYYFLQGFRTRELKSFSSVGRVYGSFGVYVNDSLVASSDRPTTIYTTEEDDSYLEGGAQGIGTIGKNFDLSLNKGWNTIEIVVQTVDPNIYGDDDPDLGQPYLQLNLYPSLFDTKLQQAYGISKVVASGEIAPTSDFDLLWNTPKSLKKWAWNQDGKQIMFNTWGVTPIDGHLVGQEPMYLLRYDSLPVDGGLDRNVKMKFDLETLQKTSSIPIIKGYKLLFR